jgi:hypothetical protein
MIPMSKQLTVKAALIFFLSAGPVTACDPEEMINELRAQCRDAIASAVTLIEPLKPALTAPERTSIDGKIKEATALCNSDKYGDGYTVTARLARFVGHIEARKGIGPEL